MLLCDGQLVLILLAIIVSGTCSYGAPKGTWGEKTLGKKKKNKEKRKIQVLHVQREPSGVHDKLTSFAQDLHTRNHPLYVYA